MEDQQLYNVDGPLDQLHFIVTKLQYKYSLHVIGLFKMFSRWIWGIFNIQIQSDRGHKLMLFMFKNKDKDLLGVLSVWLWSILHVIANW